MTSSEIRDLGLTDKNAGCACCSPAGSAETRIASAAPEPAQAQPSSLVADYLVEGMTCGHCVRSVAEELSALPDVTDVEIDLQAGGVSRVRVSSNAALDVQQIRAAVEEAGYALTSSS